MSEGQGFDENGVALDNPHLRRVTEVNEGETFTFEEGGDIEVGNKGVYFTLPCIDEAFTVSVDGPGTFTFDTHLAQGVIGLEWVGDE